MSLPEVPRLQPPSTPLEQSRSDIKGSFLVRVTRVDVARKSLTVKRLSDGLIFRNVTVWPVAYSSFENTELTMPEEGACGFADVTSFSKGITEIKITEWALSDTALGEYGLASREVEGLDGYNKRRRGLYRTTFPGQSSVVKKAGFTSLTGAGWDYEATDLSRDKADIYRRQRTMSTGRFVISSDATLQFDGPVLRPGSDNVSKVLLPDGTSVQPVTLSGHSPLDRFTGGKQDAIPFAERLERFTEFSLDIPTPAEALESSAFHRLLGVNADPWSRTTMQEKGGYTISANGSIDDVGSDHPTKPELVPVGSAKQEGATPLRKGFIVEHLAGGTLVGYNPWDKATYGKVLVPTLFPMTREGKFGTDVSSGFQEAKASTDHAQARLAAVARYTRFPFDGNTTRYAVTKEGLVLIEIGSTLPKENIPWDNSEYEHPHGAGRSVEAHLVGSAKLVIGKNRDEEESLDLTTLGQVVMRIGSDDAVLPTENRSLLTQLRAKSDALLPRSLQFWQKAKCGVGDAGDLANKTGFEKVSVRSSLDGGTFLRLGARSPKAKRRHLMNGYKDGQGRNESSDSANSRTSGRPVYGAGDASYRFHDLRLAGKPTSKVQPYFWSGDALGDVDAHGLSADIHACRDILFRVGKNQMSDMSLLLDFDGGIIGFIGKDKKGRSMSGSLAGGVELSIGSNNNGHAANLELVGDVNVSIKGNAHFHISGDGVFDSNKSLYFLAKEEIIMKAMDIRQAALRQHVSEAPDIVHNQGGHKP